MPLTIQGDAPVADQVEVLAHGAKVAGHAGQHVCQVLNVAQVGQLHARRRDGHGTVAAGGGGAARGVGVGVGGQ